MEGKKMKEGRKEKKYGKGNHEEENEKKGKHKNNKAKGKHKEKNGKEGKHAKNKAKGKTLVRKWKGKEGRGNNKTKGRRKG